MKQKLIAFYKLSRVKSIMEFYPIVMIIGVFVAKAPINMQTISLIIANFFIILSSFVVNDIADADDDALDPAKINRNPISAGLISKFEANIFLALIILLALVTLILSGLSSFTFGAIILSVGLFYSLLPFRLKARPIIDVLSHSFFLGSAEIYIFTTVYGSINDISTIFVVLGVFIVSAAGDLHNEYRDWEVDRQVGLQNSASFLGIDLTKKLNKGFNILGVALITVGLILRVISYF
jgi:4-hydroxybenzoate polyprenyltransferase